MNIITELPKDAMTLRPATEADSIIALTVFPLWRSATDGRFVISPLFIIDGEIISTYVPLGEDWDEVGTVEGVTLELRRADCGAGCRCAGEFRFVPGEGE